MAKKGENKLNILIVEDNLINRKMFEAFIKKLGHNYVNATNGKQAIDLYSKYSFDCVLMDIQMPVMDGFEATKNIRSMEKAKGVYTPVIAVSAYSPFSDRKKIIDAGMDEYVTKPVGIDVLKRVINKVKNNDYTRQQLVSN